MTWNMSSCPVLVDRILGLLTLTMKKLDTSERHFEDALAFCRKAGYTVELAWSLHDYAETILQIDAPDNHKALELLNEAVAISTELGMPPLYKRASTLLESERNS